MVRLEKFSAAILFTFLLISPDHVFGQGLTRTNRGGPHGTGYTFSDLGGGVIIQTPNTSPVLSGGFNGSLPKSEGKIFRTPSSEKFMKRYEAKRAKQEAARQERLNRLKSQPQQALKSVYQGASYKELERRRAQRNGDIITPDGIVSAEQPNLKPPPAGLQTVRRSKDSEEAPLTAREQIIANRDIRDAEAEARRILMQRAIDNRRGARRATAQSGAPANRRYGLHSRRLSRSEALEKMQAP